MRNCETGLREALKLQFKHAEVSRLTYARSVKKCLLIHNGTFLENQEADEMFDGED